MPEPPAEKGNLTIEKTVTGLEVGTTIPANAFTFTITDGSGASQTVSLPAVATAATGSSMKLTGGLTAVEPGSYTVTETSKVSTIGDFRYTDTGSSNQPCPVMVPEGDTGTAAFTNAYQKTTTEFTFQKIWDGTPANGITVKLAEGVEVTVTNQASGTSRRIQLDQSDRGEDLDHHGFRAACKRNVSGSGGNTHFRLRDDHHSCTERHGGQRSGSDPSLQ